MVSSSALSKLSTNLRSNAVHLAFGSNKLAQVPSCSERLTPWIAVKPHLWFVKSLGTWQGPSPILHLNKQVVAGSLNTGFSKSKLRAMISINLSSNYAGSSTVSTGGGMRTPIVKLIARSSAVEGGAPNSSTLGFNKTRPMACGCSTHGWKPTQFSLIINKTIQLYE